MTHPDFTLENALLGVMAGVDEVGRGPFSGHVISAAKHRRIEERFTTISSK